LPNLLRLERLRALLGRQREPFVGRRRGRIHVAGELHITAERQPADLPARAPLVRPAEQFAAEADREGIRLHPEPAADEIMAELVNEDQRPDDRQENQNREEEGRTAQAWIFPVSAAATLRASPSISSTASIEAGACGSKRASTSPTREAISR